MHVEAAEARDAQLLSQRLAEQRGQQPFHAQERYDSVDDADKERRPKGRSDDIGGDGVEKRCVRSERPLPGPERDDGDGDDRKDIAGELQPCLDHRRPVGRRLTEDARDTRPALPEDQIVIEKENERRRGQRQRECAVERIRDAGPSAVRVQPSLRHRGKP